MNMRRLAVLLAMALFALASTPASAGTVYVTLAMNASIGGEPYETVLTVTNPSTENKSFTTNFIPAATDGADREKGVEFPETTIPAGSTRILRDLIPEGSTGMLEITGDPELTVRATLVRDRGNAPGAEVPVVTSDNVVPALTDVYLQGIRKDGARTTGLGIANISSEQINCRIDAETAAGGVLTNARPVAIPPLSMLHTPDFLAWINNQSGSDVTAVVRCSGESYPFAQVLNHDTGAVAAIDPATTLDSRLIPPGVQLPCPPGAVCFERQGLFHEPSGANPAFKAQIPLESGVTYRTIRVQLTFRHGGWFGPMQDGIHNFFWIFDSDWGGTYGYMNARGPNRNIVTMLTKAGLGGTATSRPKVNFGLSPGSTYVIDYVYDLNSGNIIGTVSTPNGTEVARLFDVTRASAIGRSGALTLWVGNPDERHHGAFEVPSLGWDYSNLRIEISP